MQLRRPSAQQQPQQVKQQQQQQRSSALPPPPPPSVGGVAAVSKHNVVVNTSPNHVAGRQPPSSHHGKQTVVQNHHNHHHHGPTPSSSSSSSQQQQKQQSPLLNNVSPKTNHAAAVHKNSSVKPAHPKPQQKQQSPRTPPVFRNAAVGVPQKSPTPPPRPTSSTLAAAPAAPKTPPPRQQQVVHGAFASSSPIPKTIFASSLHVDVPPSPPSEQRTAVNKPMVPLQQQQQQQHRPVVVPAQQQQQPNRSGQQHHPVGSTNANPTMTTTTRDYYGDDVSLHLHAMTTKNHHASPGKQPQQQQQPMNYDEWNNNKLNSSWMTRRAESPKRAAADAVVAPSPKAGGQGGRPAVSHNRGIVVSQRAPPQPMLVEEETDVGSLAPKLIQPKALHSKYRPGNNMTLLDQQQPQTTIMLLDGSYNAAVVDKPRPMDETTGSRIRVVLGTTGQSFLLLLQEDNTNDNGTQHSWQNRFWRNVPQGLDQKLRTVDYVHECSFSSQHNEWFLTGRNKLTGTTQTWWQVQTRELHDTLQQAVVEQKHMIRVVFGEVPGQFIILFGSNGGFRLGSMQPISEKLTSILENVCNNKSSIVARIRGLNAQGRFLLEETIVVDDKDDDEADASKAIAPKTVFHAEGVSAHLMHKLSISTTTASSSSPMDKVMDLAMASSDKSWLLIRSETYDVSVDGRVHDELIHRLDTFYLNHHARRTTKQVENKIKDNNANVGQKRQALTQNSSSSSKGVNTGDSKDTDESTSPSATSGMRENQVRDMNADVRERIQKEIEEKREATRQSRSTKYKAAWEIAKKRRDKEDRRTQIDSKLLCVGDRVLVGGLSTERGDSVVKDIEQGDGVIVIAHLTAGASSDQPTTATVAVDDPRKVVKTLPDDGFSIDNEIFSLPIAHDKYEASVMLHHCNSKIGSCSCKQDNVVGYSHLMHQPHDWKVGDRVNVLSYANGTVIEPKARYANKPNLVHVLYDDGTSYHVSKSQVRPEKRFISPGMCSFQSTMTPDEESVLRIRPLCAMLEDGSAPTPFNENKCAERVDLRRLQRLVANLQADSNDRRRYMDEMATCLEKHPDNQVYDYCYRKLLQCYDLEKTVYMLHDLLKGQPMDPDGYIVHEVQYRSKNTRGRGRLFAAGRPIRVLGWKFPRTLTLQGIHSELYGPLCGSFAHYIDCENSDVRLLCCLAKQVGCDDIIPTLQNYRSYRPMILDAIHFDHPDVSLSECKRLASFVIAGGSYETWLQSIEETKVSTHVKKFAFDLYTEVRVLRDQLLTHPSYLWTKAEGARLIDEDCLTEEQVKHTLFMQILQTSENEVLRIMHRTFHNRGWIVRAKMFDSLLVEPRHVKDNDPSIQDMMRLVERTCEAQGWEVRLVEKDLFGRQNDPLETIVEARAVMREYPKEAEN